MAKIITQETFDEVVNENMNEFEMSREEAVDDAVKQFKAQGVNLINIIMGSSSAAVVSEAVKCLSNHLQKTDQGWEEKVSQELTILKFEMDKELPIRVHAGKQGLYPILLDCLSKISTQYLKVTLEALTSLMHGYPDLLNQCGLEYMIRYLDDSLDVNVVVQNLKWIKTAVTRHEKNRSDLIALKVAGKLYSLLQASVGQPLIVLHVCQLIRKLVSDDDVRVTCGNAHEHARALAKETLFILTSYLHNFNSDVTVVSELLLALSCLVVRDELCIMVEEQHGVRYTLDAMVTHPDHVKVNQHSLALLKGLAGSDKVKDAIINQGAAPLIISAIQRHQDSANLVAAGCVCISALALRSPQNSRALVAAGAPDLLVHVLTRWKDNPVILKHVCSAVRNQVSRCEELKDEYLQLGVEELLNEVMSVEGGLEFEAKGVLRDLGCAVKLEEQWRGRGQQLTN